MITYFGLGHEYTASEYGLLLDSDQAITWNDGDLLSTRSSGIHPEIILA